MDSERSLPMGISIKTPEEREMMRQACRAAAQVLEMIAPHVDAGVTTGDLDDICHRYITQELGLIPGAAELQGLPEVDLHLGQPRGVSRDSGA